MLRKKEGTLCVFLFLAVLSAVLAQEKLRQRALLNRLSSKIYTEDSFRKQYADTEEIKWLQNQEDPGEQMGLYWLKTNFGGAENFWTEHEEYTRYQSICRAIWNDVKCFPVTESENHPEYSVSYTDSWMKERTYGGKRGHEGTDLMASENQRGLYPVVSMTDGQVSQMGWLEKGGYRIGITAPGGGYFYYAHLDSYAEKLAEGDTVRAGDFLGYMGDSGYGKEGTRGKFPVHLHVGIYIFPEGREVSVNPFSVLKYAERSKIKCIYETGYGIILRE